MRTTITRHEVTVGWFLAGALVVAGGLAGLALRGGGLLGALEVALEVDDGQGLLPGAPVVMKGIQVGEASAVGFTDAGRVRATLRVWGAYARHVRADAVAEVVAPPVIGATRVELLPGGAAEPAAHGQTLATRTSPSLLDRVARFEGRLDEVVTLTREVLLEGRGAIARVSSLTDDVRQGDGLAGRLVRDAALADEVEATVSGARAALERFDGQVLDRAIATLEEARATLSDLRARGDALLADDGRLARLLDRSTAAVDEARAALAAARVEETTAAFREAAGSIAGVSTEATAALRRTDPALARAAAALEAVQRASDALQQLARDLQRQPNAVLFGRDPAPAPGLRR